MSKSQKQLLWFAVFAVVAYYGYQRMQNRKRA